MNFEQKPASDQPMESRVRSPRKRKKGLRRIILLTVALVIGLVAYNAIAMMKFLNKANDNKFAATGNQVEAAPWNGEERVNILMMGVDNRVKDEAARSDTMILVSIDPKTDKANMMSIMRDTYVNIPGHGKAKINSAFAIGGPNLAMKTVEDFLKVPIHYYVVTDFQGFEGVVDAIGGVDLDVEIPMDHADDGVYDIHLKKGFQHLDGKNALQYVRYRSDARADFARTERQRKLISAVVQKLKSPLVLVRFPSMLQAAESYVQTNMTTSDVMRMSTDFLNVQASTIESAQIPPVDLLTETQNYLGESILQPDVAGVQKFVRDTLQNEGTVGSGNGGSGSGAVGGGSGTGGTSGSGIVRGGNSGGSGSGSAGNGTVGSGKTGQNGSSGGLSVGGSAGSGTATVTSEQGANVRQSASTDSPALTIANTGDVVSILGKQGDWYKVKLSDGTVGYIYKQLVSEN